MRRLRWTDDWESAEPVYVSENEVKDSLSKIVIHNAMHACQLPENVSSNKEVRLLLARERAFLDERNGTLHISKSIQLAFLILRYSFYSIT